MLLPKSEERRREIVYLKGELEYLRGFIRYLTEVSEEDMEQHKSVYYMQRLMGVSDDTRT